MLVRSLQPPRGEDTGSHHLGAKINAAVVAGWENLNLKQILSTPISYWLILTWHQIKITSPKSICLLRQNNSSQTILSVMEWQYHLHQNQENKDRHAHGHNKEQNPLCSALSILNMLVGASIICKRSNNLLWNYGHMTLCLYNLRETPRNPTSLLHLLDWAKWSTMNLTQRPPKLTGAKDHNSMRFLLMDSMPFYVPVLPALSTELLLVLKRCMNNLKFLATKIMK